MSRPRDRNAAVPVVPIAAHSATSAATRSRIVASAVRARNRRKRANTRKQQWEVTLSAFGRQQQQQLSFCAQLAHLDSLRSRCHKHQSSLRHVKHILGRVGAGGRIVKIWQSLVAAWDLSKLSVNSRSMAPGDVPASGAELPTHTKKHTHNFTLHMRLFAMSS